MKSTKCGTSPVTLNSGSSTRHASRASSTGTATTMPITTSREMTRIHFLVPLIRSLHRLLCACLNTNTSRMPQLTVNGSARSPTMGRNQSGAWLYNHNATARSLIVSTAKPMRPPASRRHSPAGYAHCQLLHLALPADWTLGPSSNCNRGVLGGSGSSCGSTLCGVGDSKSDSTSVGCTAFR